MCERFVGGRVAILESAQKLRGGYYTPALVADFLARWAIQRPETTILEPSCGDGNLSVAAAYRLLSLGSPPAQVTNQLTSVELDSEEAEKAAQRLRALGVGITHMPVIAADFFAYCQEMLWSNEQFDVVIGNPPFIRYQHFDERYRKIAFQIMRSAGMKPTNLTNIWVPFVVASTLLLRDDGKLAMVIPAELLQVGYTAELRRFLADHFAAITIVTFRKLLFDGAQQEIVLLLASRVASGRGGIDVVELDDDHQLASFDFRLHDQSALKPIDHTTDKWTQYYLSEGEIQLLRRLSHNPALVRFRDIASVDVGVVTGNNNFFVLTDEQVDAHHLRPFTVPLVGRTAQLPGLVYGKDDSDRDRHANVRCHLLFPPNEPQEMLPDELIRYLDQGEQQAVHEGYKCSIRKRWYIVPSVSTPDAFLFRQINRFPKLVLNETDATSTDTIHRVRFHNKDHIRPAIAAFHNSMTFAFTEVLGRSYGGGVLELEPNEADNLPIPPLQETNIMLETLDRLSRSNEITQALDLTDHVYLRQGMGLATSDIDALRGIWEKLSHRRTSRTFKRRVKTSDCADG
ncbi:MAG: class I SAM-dependent methyltransferase [Chloroflexota bacterium]|nr:class I SAM-dependent methyltransferase [Chloroflexota bacterium]